MTERGPEGESRAVFRSERVQHNYLHQALADLTSLRQHAEENTTTAFMLHPDSGRKFVKTAEHMG
jgi:hypothetical protein